MQEENRGQEHFDALQRMQLLKSYYRWSYELFKPYIGRRIMDAGCGLGSFAVLLEQSAEYVLAVDMNSHNIEWLKGRFRGSDTVEVAQVDLNKDMEIVRDRRIDTIVCLDVLEHVADDQALLRNFCEAVQVGGHLLVKVPACKRLYGPMDLASGHYRRYSPAGLAEKATRTGWKTVQCGYMNVAGVLPYWLKSRVIPQQKNFSRTFTPWQLKVLSPLIPMLRALDRISGPPVGLSATLVARRTG